MKNLLTIFLSLFLISNLFSQIVYTNYGDGWVIPMNANLAVDVDDNGAVDFYFNQKDGDLGITPIIVQGCFVGEGSNDYTSFGTKAIKVFTGGEYIELFGGTGDYYIENDTISFYTNRVDGGVFAEGWADLEDHYIGFGVLDNPDFDGWMNISIDAASETLIIKEIAYAIDNGAGGGGIHIGQTELTTSTSLLEEGLSQVSISPNPAKDFVNLNFNYSGDKILSISILNSIGQKVQDVTIGQLTTSVEINTANLAQGMYLVRFETEDGAHIEKLSIN